MIRDLLFSDFLFLKFFFPGIRDLLFSDFFVGFLIGRLALAWHGRGIGKETVKGVCVCVCVCVYVYVCVCVCVCV